jgi:prepilin-type N-terminal cleavage/methylation domain-containing protein
MKTRGTRGMTLVELMIVLFIAGILALTLGILMVRSFESWKKSADRISTENDVRYFRRKLEYQFRSATTHPATISMTTNPNDTLRFATYFNKENLTGVYTQNEYGVDAGNNLVRKYWVANSTSPTGSGIFPASPWGGPPDQTEKILPNVTSLNFQWAGLEPTVSTSAVQVTIVQSQPLPSGGVYVTSSTFVVKSRNRN